MTWSRRPTSGQPTPSWSSDRHLATWRCNAARAVWLVVATRTRTAPSAWVTCAAALPCQPSTGNAITIPSSIGPPAPMPAANPPAKVRAASSENGPVGTISNVSSVDTDSVPATAKTSAWEGAGVLTVAHDRHAIDDHVLNPDRESPRLLVRGEGSNVLRIEDDQVRNGPIEHDAAILEPEAGSWGGGHLSHRLLQSHDPLLAHEFAQDARK